MEGALRGDILELSQRQRYALYEDVARCWDCPEALRDVDDREAYFALSRRPITKVAEDEMELISDVVSQGELYLHHFNFTCWAFLWKHS